MSAAPSVPVDRRTILRLASLVDADPRTVMRYLRGERVMPAIRLALDRARAEIVSPPHIGELPR